MISGFFAVTGFAIGAGKCKTFGNFYRKVIMRSIRRFGWVLVPALALGFTANALAAGSGGADVAQTLQFQGCTGCHTAKTKLVGPPWAWIAWRYRSEPKKKAVDEVAKFIVGGGTGYWKKWTGGIPMPVHTDLSMQQAQAMAAWVLAQAPVAPPKP